MVVLRQCCSKHYDTCGDAAALIIGVPLYCCERCPKKVSYERVMKITRDSRVFHASPVRKALAASGLDLSDINEEEIEELEEEWEAKHGTGR